MVTIIIKVLSIFLIMAVGFFINRRNIIPASATKYFVDMLILVTTPCMILSSITSKEFDSDVAVATLQVLVMGMLFFGFAFLFGIVLFKKILKGIPQEDLGVYVLSFASVNNGFMGFPITKSIFGGDIFYLMIIHNVCLTLFMYLPGPFIVNMNHSDEKISLKSIVRKALSPATVSTVIAIIMLVSKLHLPTLLFDTVDSIGAITVPLSMLVVGMQLGESNILQILKNTSLVSMSFIKMLLLPLLVFFMVNWLPVDSSVKVCMVFGSVFPTAVITSAIASMENRNAVLAAEIIAVTTLISVIAVPVVAILLSGYYMS